MCHLMLGTILLQCFEGYNSSAMLHFITGLVFLLFSKHCIIFIFKGKNLFTLKMKTVRSYKPQPNYTLHHALSHCRRIFLLLLLKQFLPLLPFPLLHFPFKAYWLRDSPTV